MQQEALMESAQSRQSLHTTEAIPRSSSFPQPILASQLPVTGGKGSKVLDSQGQFGGRRPRNEPGKPGFRGAPQKVPKANKKEPRPRGQGTNGRGLQTYNEVTQDRDYELELSLAQGKKVNLNHLLNFTYEKRGDQQQTRRGRTYSGQGQHYSHQSRLPKYNKDQFLQAHCQFLVKHDVDYSVYLADPDLLVDWTLIEQIRLRGPEVGTCPVCLHPPVAAKMTRCGHIYCWPCVLHYLALSDRAWRGCPVCADPIYRKDLKSVISIPQKQYQVGDEIEFRLMRRERDSHLPHFVSQPPAEELGNVNRERGQKLVLATPQDVAKFILLREKVELETQYEVEKEEPESCFILEALMLLKDREDQQEASYEVDEVVDISLSDIGKEVLEDSVLTEGDYESFGDKRSRYDSANSDHHTEHSKDEVSGTGTVSSIGPEDLEFQDLDQQKSELPESSTGVKKDVFYFYQAADGQHIYLHGLNAQMLIHEYGSLEKSPRVLSGVIIERDTMVMNPDTRNRLRYLRHLPLVTSFEVVEMELGPPLVSKKTVNFFHERLAERERRRRRKDRDEKKRERRIQIEEDAKMGRFPKPILKLDSTLHFPECTRDSYHPEFYESDPVLVEEDPPQENVLDNQFGGSPVSGGSWGAKSGGEGPSFAQMLRAGKLKPSPSWPVSRREVAQPVAKPRVLDPEDEEPSGLGLEYKAPAAMSLSAALNAALDEASRSHRGQGLRVEASANEGGNKKKKKSKKLLFSTGL